MNQPLNKLFQLLQDNNGIGSKARLSKIVVESAGLTKDSSVFYCADYAIRFSSARSRNFGNTVLSLSRLQKYDDRPFIVCLVTPSENYCFIANTTFLKKISHSSQELRENNIKGSFNGSDIIREFEGVDNSMENIERLYAIHSDIGFDENLPRLVEATNDIVPSGTKFSVHEKGRKMILEAPSRAMRFVASPEAALLKKEIDEKVAKFRNEILIASLIENVKVRGQIIEYLITGQDETLRQQLIASLKSERQILPEIKLKNSLGDYQRSFDCFHTETDVKTKIMILNSNPKAYNLDKLLAFLAEKQSVFMFYFIGIDPGKIVNTVLVSMFQRQLLEGTILLRHWAGRATRGTSQFEGKTIDSLLRTPDSTIDEVNAVAFLQKIIDL